MREISGRPGSRRRTHHVIAEALAIAALATAFSALIYWSGLALTVLASAVRASGASQIAVRANPVNADPFALAAYHCHVINPHSVSRHTAFRI